MTAQTRFYARLNLIVGILAWLVLLASSINQWSYLAQIHLLIFFGVAILTPLSFRLTIPQSETLHPLARLILLIQPIIIFMTFISFQAGIGSVLWGFGWLLQSSLIALFGVLRYWRLAPRTLDELCIDAGLVFTSISGVWFFFYRLSGEFFWL